MKPISTITLKNAVSAIQKLYPLEYADNAWDNTGLLLDSSIPSPSQYNNNNNNNVDNDNENNKISILLTIDLTQSVVNEAIQNKSNLILAYHPFIFSGIKKIQPNSNPQHNSILKLIQNNISVYSPHTSVDSIKNGINDWLVNGSLNFQKNLINSSNSIQSLKNQPSNNIEGFGRLVSLNTPINLSQIVSNIKKNLNLNHLQIALANKNRLPNNITDLKSIDISTIAVCAGSGSSVFKQLYDQKIDLYYTGELSHHDALYLNEIGSNVIACNHSNTERGYLSIMKENLFDELSSSFKIVDIAIAKTDQDPYQVI
ncbi:uncharacterized protein ASCRUDRAFT_10411 [Ascoidea rubescens DSM 1968]|uniref:NGG1p interacting factor 3 n=1 Tax=Ascoidea rubescens DSM 1968 TaxID=1344418 RepID=A0A1D2V918_9ASCO|nr:NGG1p interacting factor 3 [Ascoidea rubescens DSM 1968]ODV58140.1 NGG1p interacting factor 3 [Ascoidea rubescens DSM 1968]